MTPRLRVVALLAALLMLSTFTIVAPASAQPDPYGDLYLASADGAPIDSHAMVRHVATVLDQKYGTRWRSLGNTSLQNNCLGDTYYRWYYNRAASQLERESFCALLSHGIKVPNHTGLVDGKITWQRIQLKRDHLAEWTYHLVRFHNKFNAAASSSDPNRMGSDSPPDMQEAYDMPVTVASTPTATHPYYVFKDICQSGSVPPLYINKGLQYGITPGIRMLEPLTDLGELVTHEDVVQPTEPVEEPTWSQPTESPEYQQTQNNGPYDPISDYWFDNPTAFSDDFPAAAPDPEANINVSGCNSHLIWGGSLPARRVDASILLGRFQCAARQERYVPITFGNSWEQTAGDESFVTDQCWERFWQGIEGELGTGEPIYNGHHGLVKQRNCTTGNWTRGVGSYWEGYGFNDDGQAFGWDGSTNGGVWPAAGTTPFGSHQPCARDIPASMGGGET